MPYALSQEPTLTSVFPTRAGEESYECFPKEMGQMYDKTFLCENNMLEGKGTDTVASNSLLTYLRQRGKGTRRSAAISPE
jgi:hypothetical protein